MPRYEFSEGSSNKFWDITLTGKSFTTTYGKIGATGQTTIKTFKSDEDARKEHDKLVAEKTKKGYKLVGGGKATKPAKDEKPAKGGKAPAAAPVAAYRDPRNPGLEAAVAANPTDREAFSVLADWLQEQGDPRGELISLQLGYKEGQAKKLLEKHADYFLGPLAAHQSVYDEGENNGASHLRSKAQEAEWQKTHRQAFLWRNGYIYRVRLSYDEHQDGRDGEDLPDVDLADILKQVFAHPSGRFVVELAFNTNGEALGDDDLQPLIDVIAKHAPTTIRKITFGDNVDQISWHNTGNLGKMWKGVPGLKTLEIESGRFEVGKMVAPNLERAIFITGGLSKTCGKGIATAEMPKIRHLEIYYGQENYGGNCTIKEVKPLLDRTDLKNLEYLGLKNSELSDEIAKHIGGSKIVKQLKTLDLSLGVLTDKGAAYLAEQKAYLKHLEVLDLTHNYLTREGIALVKGICPKVITADQEEADEDDDDVYRYTAIGE